jgi:hypothetical protein
MLAPLVVERIATILTEFSAQQVFVEGSSVRFRSGFVFESWNPHAFRWSTHPLSTIQSGRIIVEPVKDGIAVSYHLKTLDFVSLLSIGVFVAFVAAVSWPLLWLPLLLLPFALAGYCLFFVLAYMRFSNRLRNDLEEMPLLRKYATTA